MFYYNEEGVKEAVHYTESLLLKNKTNELLRKEDVHTRRLKIKFFWANEDYSYNWLRHQVLKTNIVFKILLLKNIIIFLYLKKKCKQSLKQ